MSFEAIEERIAQCVVDALATYETNRNTRNERLDEDDNRSLLPKELALLCSKMVLDEEEKVKRKCEFFATRQAKSRMWQGPTLLGLVKGKNMLEPYLYATNENFIILDHALTTATCYECVEQGYYKSNFPKLKNWNCENQARSSEARGRVYALG
nr:hypothetical protein [Tanacetum cinerariifolium]